MNKEAVNKKIIEAPSGEYYLSCISRQTFANTFKCNRSLPSKSVAEIKSYNIYTSVVNDSVAFSIIVHVLQMRQVNV